MKCQRYEDVVAIMGQNLHDRIQPVAHARKIDIEHAGDHIAERLDRVDDLDRMVITRPWRYTSSCDPESAATRALIIMPITSRRARQPCEEIRLLESDFVQGLCVPDHLSSSSDEFYLLAQFFENHEISCPQQHQS